MQILNLPGPEKPHHKDQWFASSLQFASDGQSLLLELFGRHDRTMGRLDTSTGQWEPRFNYFNEYHPLQPCWRRDYSCVVDGVYEGEIHVKDPKEQPPVTRIFKTNRGIWSVGALTFSADGRWLYAVEEIGGQTPQSIVARADVQLIFTKQVTQQPKVNRLTGNEYISRSVKPTRLTQCAHLPAGVVSSLLGVSPDGRMVAVGSTTGDTHLFRVRGGVSLGLFKRKSRKRIDNVAVRRIEFSPSGRQLGVVVDGMVRVWDVKSAELLWDAEDAKAQVTDLAYHPDGNTLAVVRSDGVALFLDAQTGAVRKRYAWKVGQLNSVAFSPDGLTCAAGGEKGQVVVWDVDS